MLGLNRRNVKFLVNTSYFLLTLTVRFGSNYVFKNNQFSFISGMTERRPAIHKSNTQLIISVTVTQ